MREPFKRLNFVIFGARKMETKAFVQVQHSKSVRVPPFLGSLLLNQQNAQKAAEMLIDDSWGGDGRMPCGNSDWMYRRFKVLSSYLSF